MSEEIIKHNNNIGKPTSKKLDLTNLNTKAFGDALSNVQIPRLFYQLVVFILDASDSMTWEGITGKSKGEEIHEQIVPIIKRLQISKNKNCFDINMYAFSNESKEFLEMKNVTEIDADNFNFNPCVYVDNYQTRILQTIQDVELKVQSYLTKYENNGQALIMILSDGDLNDYRESFELCRKLKTNKKITIASYLLEDKNWRESLPESKLEEFQENIKKLSSIDSNDIHFFHSKVDPEEIRKHMIKSISTVSKID